jgi:hypothetical protein
VSAVSRRNGAVYRPASRRLRQDAETFHLASQPEEFWWTVDLYLGLGLVFACLCAYSLLRLKQLSK